MPVLQIKIGPQKELVVDEQSLVIENKELKKIVKNWRSLKS